MPRGGKRPGAGRPAPDGNRISIAARVTQETSDKLRQIAKDQGQSLGKTIDELVRYYSGGR